MAAHFQAETLRFLRGLSKHNDRTWFEERRAIYERSVKVPLLMLIEEINQELLEFAPEHVRPAHKIAMRIYRDTRFSPDKRPYKTHLAAWWAHEGLQKTSAAGFFVQFGPAGGFAAAGIYAPEREELLAIRRWMAEHHERYRATLATLLRKSGKRGPMQPMDPQALTRNPKGFDPEHPASDLLRARNWGVMTPLAEEEILSPAFATAISAHFRRAAPLVQLMNEPFLSQKGAGSRGFEVM